MGLTVKKVLGMSDAKARELLDSLSSEKIFNTKGAVIGDKVGLISECEGYPLQVRLAAVIRLINNNYEK